MTASEHIAYAFDLLSTQDAHTLSGSSGLRALAMAHMKIAQLLLSKGA
jgi:hypothetical protein